jgi:hypothetical protein
MVFKVDSDYSITVGNSAGRSPWIFNTHLQWIQLVAESCTTIAEETTGTSK